MEQMGKIIFTFDNGQTLESDNWSAKDGEEWTDWLNDPDYEFSDPDEFSTILTVAHNRVLAIEWVEYDN